MLNGEAHQAFVTIKYKAPQQRLERITNQVCTSMRLHTLLLVICFDVGFPPH